MKLSKLVFTHPRNVFGGDSETVFTTDQTGQAPRVDSIEVTELGVVLTRGDVQAWVPASSVESGIVAKAAKGKAA